MAYFYENLLNLGVYKRPTPFGVVLYTLKKHHTPRGLLGVYF